MNQSTVGNRLKTIRTEFKLTQQSFADRIGISRGALANYEVDRNEPIDAVISLICREFGISEDWLRYGVGSMKRSTSRDEEIERFMNSVLNSENEDFRRRLINVLCRLDEKEWELLESMALKLAEEAEKGQKSFWPVEADQTDSQPGSKIIKIAGRDGSMEELALTDEDANEYLNRIDQLPDVGDDL